jgi:photosynthetic reaction center cytochrome c subunit
MLCHRGENPMKPHLVWAVAGVALHSVVSLCALALSAARSSTDGVGVDSADKVYKNIQQLRGVPADQLIPVMQFITYSLGVECNFCHIEGAFDKDDKKEKQTARQMIKMMLVINQTNFEGKRQVTCYTCHRGSPHPQTIPGLLAAAENAGEDEDQVPPGVPSPERVLAAYAQSLGGVPAIRKLATRVEKGTIRFGGKELPVEIFSKDPGSRTIIIHLPDGDNISTYGTTSGWTTGRDGTVRDLPAPEIASARLETDLQLPLRLMQLLGDLRSARPRRIGNHEVYVVDGYSASRPAASFYFDKQSGLLLRMVRYVDTPLGLNPTQIDYADYRAQGAVKVAFKRTVARPDSTFVIQIEKTQDNVPVDAAHFARPADRRLSQSVHTPPHDDFAENPAVKTGP